MMYGKHNLKATLAFDDTRTECPVDGCQRWVDRQRHRFVRDAKYRCPDHPIYVSRSTFEYEDPIDNLLWKDADDLRLLEKLQGVKRESRMARERSEDAVTWNVVRGLEKAGALGSWLASVSGFDATGARVAYWSCDPEDGRVLPLLGAARAAFAEDARRETEPDVIVLCDTTVFFVEAKFTSDNRTQPSDANRAARYTAGGQAWYPTVMKQDFQAVAVEARFYELLRMWLLGTWAAHRHGLDFCLVNLVRSGHEPSVEEAFGKFIATSTGRRFRRATWEGASQHLQAMRPSEPVTSRLMDYMRDKTAGYGADGRLRGAFSL